MLLAIDSGANLGWAVFNPQTKQMEGCGLKNYPKEGAKPLQRIVIERPHTGRTRARACDILTLAIRAGEVGGVLRYLTGVEPEYIEPGKWKGQLDKKKGNRMVEAKLSPQEIAILNKIAKKSTQHNILDAIGIGLFIVGRI